MELTAERRLRHREALVAAAQNAIALHGLKGLKARDLAHTAGIALGAIYNLVADLDELYLRVASRTLSSLDAALAKAVTAAGPASDPTTVLVAIAHAYRRFASDNLHLWRALFEFRMAPDAPLPEWARADQLTLFRHILEPLRPLTPALDDAARMTLAKTLFGAVHGIVLLGLEEKFVGVPVDRLDAQIADFVRAVCAGLAAR